MPSRIALATSLASARVGSGRCSMDSSIWVAVMTVLPRSSEARIIRFCRSGTKAGPISTPRSPRATMSSVRLDRDLRKRRDGLRLLDLRDHVNLRIPPGHERTQLAHVGRRAHEREGDKVDAQLERECEVAAVLLCERRNGNGDAWDVHALGRADDAGDENLAPCPPVLDLLHLQMDVAVVDQEVVAGLQHLPEHGREHAGSRRHAQRARKRRRPRRRGRAGSAAAGSPHAASAPGGRR